MEDEKSRGIKPRRTRERDRALDLEPGFRGPIAAPAAGAGKRSGVSQQAWLSMRLYFQPSRAEFVERRQEESDPGVIKLYCKLCQRLIVASRDEFVLPIAAKAHKCRGLRRAALLH